jgi:hypothetical protein
MIHFIRRATRLKLAMVPYQMSERGKSLDLQLSMA